MCYFSCRLDVILCLIGETFEESGTMVNGAVVSIRPKMDKICLWLRDSGPKDAVLNVGRKLKKSLGFGVQSEIYFEAHADTMLKASSQVKSKFIV
jgi:translation initiation factor 4E